MEIEVTIKVYARGDVKEARGVETHRTRKSENRS